MTFYSTTFLGIFFPIVFVLYYVLQNLKYRNSVLLLASLIFYGIADIHFLPVLLFEIVIAFFAGIIFEKNKNKLLFYLFLIIQFLPLLVFKYSRYNLILPLGISFFTFQSVGYVIDVFKGKYNAERNFLLIALFISFFPVISSGPIQRANCLIPQFKESKTFQYSMITDGLKLLAFGMFKKLLIADSIALYVNNVFENLNSCYGVSVLFAVFLYSIQIYCDFSGYSDMAMGIAKTFGFDIAKNFDHPYFSESIGEFWRRWHMSLSFWLRDYVYISLGGSRVKPFKIYLNLIITFIVSGIWHGLSWNFALWGLIYGILLCFERITQNIRDKWNFSKTFKILITFCIVSFVWIFFRTNTIGESILAIKKILHFPLEIINLPALRNMYGIKRGIKEILYISGNSFGYKWLLKTFVLAGTLFIIEVITLKKPGLEIIKNFQTDFRWILYIILILLISTQMPILGFEGNISNFSTNFIYNNF